jgi:hypothetical protein
VQTSASCIALVNDIDERFRDGSAELIEADWTLMSSAIAKWKGSVMREPAPSRVWKIMHKSTKKISTMVVGDETPITQDEALFFARQRFFDDVLTVE